MTEESQRFNTAKIDAAIREERDRLVVALRSLADKIGRRPSIASRKASRGSPRRPKLWCEAWSACSIREVARTRREDPCRYCC